MLVPTAVTHPPLHLFQSSGYILDGWLIIVEDELHIAPNDWGQITAYLTDEGG